MAEDSEVSIEDMLAHPNRRTVGGPSDVEWALLVREVSTMKKTLDTLSTKMDEFINAANLKCDTCKNGKTLEDHENRIRSLEKLIWKAVGVASFIAAIGGFLLDKIFK